MNPLNIVLSVLLLSSSTYGSDRSDRSDRKNNIVPVPEYGHGHQNQGNQQVVVEGQLNNERVLGSCFRNRQHYYETLLPVPLELLRATPVQRAVEAFDETCFMTAYNTSASPTYTPSVEDVHMYLITNNGNVSVPTIQPETLVQQPTYDASEDLVIFVTGFPFNLEDETDAVAEVLNAYRKREAENIVVYDVGSNLYNLYRWSALDTQKTGELIGQSLVKLAQVVPLHRIHLVGHSVGAHVAGAAGRYFYHAIGQHVPRITALEPSRVCYRRPNALVGLQRGDAEFIDVIHTSALGLGTVQSVGDVDFYPNGPNVLVPGTNNLVDAHNQALRYYAETVVPGGERNFMAVECDSIEHVRQENNRNNHGREVPLGYATPTNVRGNYFLDVNAKRPYGQNNNNNQRVGASATYNYQQNSRNPENYQRNYRNNNYQNL